MSGYNGPGGASSPFKQIKGKIPKVEFGSLRTTPYVLIAGVPGYYINVISMSFNRMGFGAAVIDPFYIFASERVGDPGNAIACFLPNEIYGGAYSTQLQTYGGFVGNNASVGPIFAPAFQNTGYGFSLTLEQYVDTGITPTDDVEFMIYYTLEEWAKP